MSTSLKEQLQKLAVPQSSAVTRGKKRPSIFFTPEDAAEKSRETMYEIGVFGLEALMRKNPKFGEFRNTLFHETYKNFERSVHDTVTNEKLDKHIRKFFLYLSPYFVLKDACMTLEWLIYRYNIHEYNRNDFVMMIMPYHETNMFVRALQVVQIKNENDVFSWMKQLQRNGVHLSKNMLYNHAASNPKFLKDVSTYLLAAVKLHEQPERLTVLFNFYCLTFCGAIEHAQHVDDRHVTSMIPALLKGLKSDIPDFLAGSLLILSKLLLRTGVSEKLLNKFIENISQFNVPTLRESCVMSLVKVYQMQEDFREISETAVRSIAAQKWVPKVLERLNEKYSVRAFFDVLLRGIVQVVAVGGETDDVQKLMINILDEVKFGEDVVSYLISLIYKSASEITRNQPRSWLKSVILSVETKYSATFDKEIDKLLKVSPEETLSKGQKKFKSLLTSTTGLSNNQLLQQLYHPAASIRKESIKNLMATSSNLKDREQAFLRDALLDRLNDDNPDIALEALKCSKKFIAHLIDSEILVGSLVKLLSKCQREGNQWSKVSKLTLQILCKISKDDDMLVFVSVLSYLLPNDDAELGLAKMIVETKYFKNSQTFSGVSNHLLSIKNCKEFVSVILDMIKNSKMNIITLIESLKQRDFEKFDTLHQYLASLLLCSLLPDNCSPNLVFSVLEIIITYIEDTKLKYTAKFETIANGVTAARKNYFSLQGFLKFIEILLEKCQNIDLSSYDFSKKTSETKLYISIFNILLKGCCNSTKDKTSITYANTLKYFLSQYCPDFNSKLQTFINIAIANNEDIDNVLKLRCLRTVNSLLISKSDHVLDNNFVPYLLICLENTEKEIRTITINIIETLISGSVKLRNTYLNLIKNVIQYREEILLDQQQIPVVINNILESNSNVKKCLNLLIDVMNEETLPIYVKIGIGNLIMQCEDIKVYNKLSQICLNMLNSNGDDYSLNAYESQFINNVINKLDLNVAAKLQLDTDITKLFSFAIESDKYKLRLDNDISVLAVVAMSKIDKDLFDNFEENIKLLILKKTIETSATSQNPDVVVTANKIFKHIDLDSKLILDHLIKMRDVQSPKINESKRKRRISIVPTVDILDTSDWKRGVTLLECIHDKKKIQNPSVLLPVLFDILKKCLDFDEQGNVEYPKQLILSSILNSCRRTEDLENLSENVFNIEIIVQCIRASQNPQTHHEALLVLAHTAHLIPNQVLHHIMAIFTFMGSSVLRYDDAYSFQIINKIVDTIFPILIENNSIENIINVLHVFVDAILDVPEHRRTALYKNLLEKVGVNDNLYIFLLLMFESHVIHANSEKQKAKETTRGELTVPKRLDIAADIARLFSADIIISTCTKLVKYLQDLPEEKDDSSKELLIDIKHYTPKEFRHYKYVVLTFISTLLSSKEFVHHIASLSDEILLELEPTYKNMIINILTYIQGIARISDKNINTPQAQYWKVMLHHSYDVLDSINALLTPQMFLLVIRGLSTHNLITVRRRALELLNSKLQHDSNFFRNCTENELHVMIPCLINIIKQIEDNIPSENEVVIQTSLLSLKLFIKLLAPDNPEKFVPVLDFITVITKSGNAKGNILASLILCLAELCSQLRAHAISNLAKFMPALIKLLKSHKHQDVPDLLLLSTVTAIQKVIESLPLFLSSYLEKLLFELSLITSKWSNSSDQKLQPFLTKLKNIKSKIGTSIPARVLIPAVEGSYRKIIETASYNAVGSLMEVLTEKLKNIENSDVQSNLNELTSFFMNALQFRSEMSTSLQESNEVETHIIKTFVVFILKLSESTFRPLYYKIYDWAIRSDTKTERIITFYSLSSEIASSLKGLFVLFAGNFLNNAATILDSCNLLKQKETYFENEDDKSLMLLEYVLKTLHAVFLHDSQRFMNKERFDVLMQPVVDQLENNLGGEDLLVSRCKELVIPTVVQFAVAVGDDALWKQLNYQILLKMRHTSAKIRLSSLKCILELSRKLGEEFLPLLPETIPFLAELLEDEEEEVEKTCQRTVQEMEKILGEPLQKYF